MRFDYQTYSIETSNLTLRYFLVPWDTEIIGRPIAQISHLEIQDHARASADFETFRAWSAKERIALCSCRLDALRVADSLFLQEHGFRLIELNYTPELRDLKKRAFEIDTVQIENALATDREALQEMVSKAFVYGRFHQDPRIGQEIGDRRYRAWMANAFDRPSQEVLKCVLDGEIVGFFVVESPAPTHRFWSLVGLSHDWQGYGLGKRTWRAMLHRHQASNIETVSTSVSSHNLPVLNLYVSLGFRFTRPLATLHWCPTGSLQ